MINNNNLEQIINSNSFFHESEKEKTQRGAEVYGHSLCPEVFSYIEDVNPEIIAQRLLTMAFAGNISSVAVPSLSEDMDFDEFDIS